jgi:hypothetical protein
VPTRDQVLELLDHGHSYETAAKELGLPAGQVFMIATGLPADGSDAAAPEELENKRLLPGSSQHLVNPPAVNPTRSEEVIKWVQHRAARELKQGT